MKPCPFCGNLPEQFDKAGNLVKHPVTDNCPLDMLVFSIEKWEKRAEESGRVDWLNAKRDQVWDCK